jgi:hypothetical protein
MVTLAAGLIAMTLAAINIKDYFWFQSGGPSLSIPESKKPGMYQRMRNLVAAKSLLGHAAGHGGPRGRRQQLRAAVHRRPADGLHAHPDAARGRYLRLLHVPGAVQHHLRHPAL